VINLNLIGLPGSGKLRVKQSLMLFLEKEVVNSVKIHIDNDEQIQTINWLVVDIRSKLTHLQAEKFLVDAVKKSSLIIFNFAESSDLDVQIFWQKWKATNASHVPSVRLFYSAFKADFGLTGFLQNTVKNEHQPLKLQTLDFSVKQLNLEHLMAGLDACKQNLQMDIWRIKGAVQTTEYANPVALEGTVNRWDTFSCDEAKGKVTIQGLNLNKEFLKEVVDASQL